jgi:hypothetical protein
MGEESRKGFLGHVEYRYFCRGMERSDATYKASASDAYGVDSGLQPLLVDSENAYLESGGTSDNNSDLCKTHQTEVCLRPNTPGGKYLAPAGLGSIGAPAVCSLTEMRPYWAWADRRHEALDLKRRQGHNSGRERRHENSTRSLILCATV